MPGREKTLPPSHDLLTRCPQCHTAFRVTAAQLAVRNGRVRCGTCQHPFDAYTARIAAPLAPAPSIAPPTEEATEPPIHLLDVAEPSLLSTEPAAEAAADPAPADWQSNSKPVDGIADKPADPLFEALPAADSAVPDTTSPPTSHRTAWLFLLACVLLTLLLLGQMTYRFRTELATVLPGVKDVFTALNIEVPLPHQADMISIEASDLQADAVRNLLILNATIKNRAPWSQAYPLLELTLTDSHDAVLLRRSLQPVDYLPTESPPLFGPHTDLAVRLWLDPHGATAAGYRLYVYYR